MPTPSVLANRNEAELLGDSFKYFLFGNVCTEFPFLLGDCCATTPWILQKGAEGRVCDSKTPNKEMILCLGKNSKALSVSLEAGQIPLVIF
jgi:hypothetical protein